MDLRFGINLVSLPPSAQAQAGTSGSCVSPPLPFKCPGMGNRERKVTFLYLPGLPWPPILTGCWRSLCGRHENVGDLVELIEELFGGNCGPPLTRHCSQMQEMRFFVSPVKSPANSALSSCRGVGWVVLAQWAAFLGKAPPPPPPPCRCHLAPRKHGHPYWGTWQECVESACLPRNCHCLLLCC